MKHVRLLALALLAGSPAFPQKPNPIVELQRDVALMSDQVRKLQNSMDEKIAALSALMQQAVENANRTNATMAQLETILKERLVAQEKSLVAPLTTIGAKVDRVAEETHNVSSNVAELASQFRKQQLQLVDLANAIRTLQAPPEPPKSNDPASASGPPPGMTAQSTYENAMRDKMGGNADLAMQQFQDYLKHFPGTTYAPNAQFYIGEIQYNRGEHEAAIHSFDTVIEKYPDNNKTPDALLMKGRAALKLGDRQEATKNFDEVAKRFPTSEVATKARQELKVLRARPTQKKKQ